MSTPLVTVGPGTYGFEALLEMTRRGIHHLVVVDAGRLLGVVSSNDFLRLQATHPVTVAREIGLAASVDDLARLGVRITALVRRLVDEGGTPYDVGRIVAELNDRMVERVLELATGPHAPAGPPPVPFCWLAFGSEARREQTLRTDQDNGLAYADPPPADAAAVQAYFARLAAEINGALVRIGFPECPGRIMASNPEWCQPVGVWTRRFRDWMQESGPAEVLAGLHLLRSSPGRRCRDAGVEPARGDPDGGAGLPSPPRPPGARRGGSARRPHRLRESPGGAERAASGHRRPQGRRRDSSSSAPPGSTRSRSASRRRTRSTGSGRRPRGRCTARPSAARSPTPISSSSGSASSTSSSCLERGEPADNRISPGRLSHAETVLLRDALRTVTHVQAGLRERYATDLLQ